MSLRAPDVRFVTTSDGVSIACWALGEGPPIVITHNWSLSDVEKEWEIATLRSLYEDLARRHTVIRFDARLAGVSDHEAPEPTAADICLDIDAVADGFDVDTFALLATSVLAPVALEYAATRPERVSSLIIADPDLTPAEGEHGRALRGTLALSEASGAEYAMGIYAPLWVTPDEVDVARSIATAAYERLASVRSMLTWDGTPHLGQVTAPTLVLMSTDSMAGDVTQARTIAAGIDGARMVRVDGHWAPYYADRDTVLAALHEHLGTAARPTRRSAGVRTVVFTDVAGSTAYTNTVGDEAARAEVKRIESLVAAVASDHGGRVVKHLGDGSMLVFVSPTAAVEFGVNTQAALEDGPLGLRIGIAAGEPIEEEGDLHGAVVNLAARLAAEARPGRVVVSDATRQLLVGKAYDFTDAGSRRVKGFTEPIEMYEVAPPS